MDGWGRLGANMFGGSGAAFQQGANQEVSLQSRLLDARKKKDEEVARSKFTEALSTMGLPPEQASGMATLLQGGANPNNVSQARLGMQEFDQRGQIWDQASGGASIADMNPLLAALQGKPLDQTKISGGVAYDPNLQPGMAQMMATPVGESQMLANQARANQSNAAAGAQAALARKHGVQADAGGFAPRAAGGGKIDYRMLDLLLTEEKGGAAYPDAAAQGEFLAWQAQQTDPRMQDMRTAVAEFKNQRDTGMGQFFDGSGAVPARVDLGGAAAPAAAAGPAPRARNPATGEVLELRNGQWVPAQ